MKLPTQKFGFYRRYATVISAETASIAALQNLRQLICTEINLEKPEEFDYKSYLI